MPTYFLAKPMQELREFANQWDTNLKDQGFGECLIGVEVLLSYPVGPATDRQPSS